MVWLLSLTAGAQSFSFRQMITEESRKRYDHLGSVLVRNEHTLVAGIPEKDVYAETDTAIVEVGKVNVYRKEQNKWILAQEIMPPQVQEFARFGHSVAICNGIMVIGAPLHSVYKKEKMTIKQSGMLYVFIKDTSGRWNYDTCLHAPQQKANSWFGFSVACNGDEIVAGAPLEDEGNIDYAGAVYVFGKNVKGKWLFGKRLISTKPAQGAKFGNTLITGSKLIVVGEPAAAINGVREAGRVEVFRKKQEGYIHETDIDAPVTVEHASFGASLSVSPRNVLVIGAPGMDTETKAAKNKHAGKVYTYHYTSTNRWVLQQTLEADDAEQGALFGSAVDISGPYMAVSAPVKSIEGGLVYAGVVYLFKEDYQGKWTFYKKLIAPVPVSSAGFGKTLAMWYSEIVIGSYREGNDAAGKFIFDAGALYDYGN